MALRWAQRFPDEVQCLVMINSSLRGIAPVYQRLRPRQYPRLLSVLLCSRSDEMFSWRCSQAMEKRWGWPLEIHSKAGHDLPLDDLDWVVERIQHWRNT